ncbi:hypothetical protein PSN45_002865 [Yamadazyma tenuis]|uniref:Opaque-phase-specific protein OP4 n=1 Tax=Candida tenuis (strain ATCC 10573 / BCRC 21748 / CBS 615 / JCM 9827 / NBRC 10315 / NRRL Y-1498 / VKM Y-70) TaxID=590646 RepID=G3AWF6_CANTC|nr:uncharacterized protein CANTEDRAFT_112249 [Yamadazyma tenuis ATCC 10573]EGV66528.1 hypothetical protein CANTEDRAFT_112249 [Yamadazyma tenuis ATCC 10573]WEJ95350.1 hypothetical protein PSN45_002865 [Yamadazyma tenuis]
MKLSTFCVPLLALTSFTNSQPLGTSTSTEVGLSKREYTILTEFFTAIEKTGVAPKLIKLLDGNKITEPILVKAIVAFLKTQDLTNLLVAVDKSGLAVDIFLRALQDSSFFPGLYTIIDGLKDGTSSATPTSSSLDTVGLVSEISTIASTYAEYAADGLSSILSTVADDLDIGSGTGIISYLDPIFNLVGLGSLADSDSGTEVTLNSAATAAASGVTVATSTGTTATGTKAATTTTTGTKAATGTTATGTTATGTKAATTTKATSTATSTSTSTSSSSTSGWLSSLFNTVSGWFDKRDFDDETADVLKKMVKKLAKRDNSILDNLVESLEKSGLAMQVVVGLIEDSANYPFVRDLIIKIVQDGVISIADLTTALNSSNLLNDAIIGALTSSDLGITIT